MEEISKYYTPELSEFHVGFSYEFKNHRTKNVWTKAKLYNHEDLRFLGENYMNTQFRVPFLSKENIESLGWKEHQIYPAGETIFITNDNNFDYELLYNSKKNNIKITKHWEVWLKGKNKGTLFTGIIKNANELKKLMKQIGI